MVEEDRWDSSEEGTVTANGGLDGSLLIKKVVHEKDRDVIIIKCYAPGIWLHYNIEEVADTGSRVAGGAHDFDYKPSKRSS
jgi:hypothetical protein